MLKLYRVMALTRMDSFPLSQTTPIDDERDGMPARMLSEINVC